MTTEQRYNKEIQESSHKVKSLYKINQWNVFKRDAEYEGDISSEYIVSKKMRFPPYKDFGVTAFRFETEASVLSFCTQSSEHPLRYLLEEVFTSKDVEVDENLYCTRESDDPIIKRMTSNENGNCMVIDVGIKKCVVAASHIKKDSRLVLIKKNKEENVKP